MNKLIKEDFDNAIELENEKDRIRDVIDIMKDVEYGFINQKTGEKITDRDWIHRHDLDGIYKTNEDPRRTIKDKLGICKDQSLAFKYLMNKYHPEDEVKLYALTTDIQGHCVPVYLHDSKWFYAEFSWNNEYGIHGPFDSQEELEDYLNYVYYMNHKEDNNLESRDEVDVEEIEGEQLLEDTRAQIVSQSRNAGQYTGDQTRGKNRFERKKWSKVAKQVKSFNQINMDDFFKKDQLDIKIPVTGETQEYTVTVRVNGVCAEIAKNIKNNNNIFEFKTVVQALTRCFNVGNVYVNCTCDDYKYRFNHWSVVNGIGTTDTAHDPGPGRGIANPNDDKGKGCKHVLLCLANMAWLMNVASVIRNYINYFAEHRKPAFNKLIFPKLYGVPFDAAPDENLVPDDEALETNENIIDVINDFAKTKGRFKKGTGKNEYAGKGKMQGPAKQEETEEKKEEK